MSATVLLTAAVTQQRSSSQRVPVEAKIDVPVDQTIPVKIPVNGSITDTSTETTIVTVMARPIAELSTATSN